MVLKNTDTEDEWDENLTGNRTDRKWLYCQTETKREHIVYKRSQRRLKKHSRLEALEKLNGEKKNSKFFKINLNTNESHERNMKNLTKQIYGKIKLNESPINKSKKVKDENNFIDILTKNEKPKFSILISFPRIELLAPLKSSEKFLSLNILKSSQIRRDALEKIYDEPWMDKFVNGLFIKISVGEQNDNQLYSICEVCGIETYPRKYSFGFYVTKKSLLVHLNRKKQVFKMILVSNRPFQKKEFQIWSKILKYTNRVIPSGEGVQDLVVKRHYYRKKFNYTELDLYKIQKQKMNEQLKNLTNIKNLFSIKLQIQTDKEKADYKKDIRQSQFLKNLLLKIEKEEEMRNFEQIQKIRENNNNKLIKKKILMFQKKYLNKKKKNSQISREQIRVQMGKSFFKNDFLKKKIDRRKSKLEILPEKKFNCVLNLIKKKKMFWVKTEFYQNELSELKLKPLKKTPSKS